MKAKQIKSMSKADVEAKLLELRKEKIKLNAQIASGTNIKNPGLVKQTKKSIARLIQKLEQEE